MKKNIKKDVEFIKFKEKLYNVKHEVRSFFEDWNEEKVNNLEDPQQLNRCEKAIATLQWGGRFVAAGGGVLSLTDYPIIGGSIAVAYPLVESFSSHYKEKNAERQKEWEKFSKDTRKLWDACHKYLTNEDIIRPIEEKARVYSENEFIEMIANLRDKATEFTNEIREEDGISALGSKTKEEFPQRLWNNWESGKKQIERVEKAIVIFLEWAENFNSAMEVSTQKEEVASDFETHIVDISSSSKIVPLQKK